MKKAIAPVVHHDHYTTSVQKVVLKYFADVLIDPLHHVIFGPDRANSMADDNTLRAAIIEGQIWYRDGAFRNASGEHYNAATSSRIVAIGAKYDGRSRTWRIELSAIPLDIRQSIYQAKDASKEAHKAVSALLLLMLSNVESADAGIDVKPALKTILDSSNAQLNKALKQAGAPEIGIPSSMKSVVEEIDEALNIDAKRIMREEIEALLLDVQTGMNSDAPLDALKKSIEKSKKRILHRTNGTAEHAAALILSEFRYAQAMRLGANSYIWRTMRDNRVRHDHRALEGKTFTWDSPPITNQRTGARNHPGFDQNCRCTPSIIINV